MQITFNLPHVFSSSSSKVDNAYALRALLDLQVALSLATIRRYAVPGLYESGVTYGRTVLWEPTAALYLPNKHKKPGTQFYFPVGFSGGERKGDCKSLAPALIAEYTLKGIPCRPVFRFVPRPDSGIPDFHILCQVPRTISADGWKDPSKDLGMGKEELDKFYGPNSYGVEL